MSKTSIQWTDVVWNPTRGCSRVSEGCRNCYAERVAVRFSGPGQPYEGLARRKLTIVNNEERDPGNRVEARWTGEVRTVPEHLADPLRWKKPRRIFVNSMSDLFHEKLTNEQIAAVFGVMAAAPQHTFQVLTKRATRMREWFRWASEEATPIDWQRAHVCWGLAKRELAATGMPIESSVWNSDFMSRLSPCWPLPNVWIGVSVENQEAADERIPELLRTPAAVRFLSCEPLIGPVNIEWYLARQCSNQHGDPLPSANLGWVIAGCESGPGARECKVEWLRALRDQCEQAGVPFFLKQAVPAPGSLAWDAPKPAPIVPSFGSKWKPGAVIELPYLDGKQWAQFPEGVSRA